MTGLIDELTRRLPDRWVANTLGPGVLWLAVALLAVRLGNGAALDRAAATDLARELAALARDRPGEAVGYGVLATGAAVLVAQAARVAGAGLRAVWLGRWAGPASGAGARLTRWRARRAGARLARSASVLPAIYLPQTPTWIGDRMRLAAARVEAQYGLSLALIWPRLWQLVGADTRDLVQQARARFELAGTIGGWAGCYAVLAVFYWPAAPAAVLLALAAWRRGRLAAALYGETLESTVDLRYRELAQALGHQPGPGPGLPPLVADAINDQLHKGATAQPQARGTVTEVIR